MNKFIPLSVPNLKGKELEYVTQAIQDAWVSTGGPFIDKFEEKISKYLKVEQAVACQSGTAGLHLALKLCDVGEGDEVIVPTLTFIAAVNPVKYCNAEPIFMDCDDTLNMDLNKLQQFCSQECMVNENKLINKKTGKTIKAILVVHVFGNMIDMENLINIASKYNLKVIEDSTEALGGFYTEGKYKNKFAGTIGDFGVYSFNGNKIITTGGGGMLVGGNKKLVDKAKYLSTQSKDDGLYFKHNEIGYNYRMTNVQAAIGLAQLEQLENFIEIKRNNYEFYKKEIDLIKGLKLLSFNKNIRQNYWFYSLLIDKDKYGLTRDELLQKLVDAKIQTRPIWGLIHEQKPYVKSQAYKIIKANEYYEKVLNIPCSSNLHIEDLKYVIKQLKKLGD